MSLHTAEEVRKGGGVGESDVGKASDSVFGPIVGHGDVGVLQLTKELL